MTNSKKFKLIQGGFKEPDLYHIYCVMDMRDSLPLLREMAHLQKPPSLFIAWSASDKPIENDKDTDLNKII